MSGAKQLALAALVLAILSIFVAGYPLLAIAVILLALTHLL